MTLIVCGLAEVPAIIAARAPSHMITLLDAASMIETPAGLPPDHHLRLSVNDIAEPTEGLILPSADLVHRLLAFGRAWDARTPMIVHCWAGISRSSASAFILACDRNPGADEHLIAMRMRRAAKHAYPNRKIVALADDILGRRGRMVDAVEAMGDYEYSGHGVPFDFSAAH
ncbi:MAG: hypothetical protein KBC34_10845 [Phenylobacterium sp.]|nr:hypothetical protein [Phenylobacterium sp.]